MRQRLTWLTVAPLMLGGLLTGHVLGYRLAIADPHERGDELAHSGHAYLDYLPFAVSVCVAVLLAGLALQAFAAFRGEPRRPATSPLIVLLPPISFVVQEFTERFAHGGHVSWMTAVEPVFLVGLSLQLPFALAALLVAWALDSAARALGSALAARQPQLFPVLLPAPVRVASTPRVAGLARGYGERAPPLLRRP